MKDCSGFYRTSARISALLFLCAALALPLAADDCAASTAAGGIQFRKEQRISMEKERLTISPEKVKVDFWFLNETGQDITTEVAFPVPPYHFDWDYSGGPTDFRDFKLWVDGKELPYKADVRAELAGKNHAGLLRSLGIDASTFGKYDWKKDPPNGSPEISRLSAADKQRLVKLGLLNNLGDAFPQWTVVKTYYWNLTFPAHNVLHVSHEYTPAWGWMDMTTQDLEPSIRKKGLANAEQRANGKAGAALAGYKWYMKQIENSCIDLKLAEKLRSEYTTSGSFVLRWVDYILVTGRNWDGPIKDFELVVDRPKPTKSHSWYISFCWNGKIKRPDASHVEVYAKDFTPTHDLHVAFLGSNY
jgi:hypothetical protein